MSSDTGVMSGGSPRSSAHALHEPAVAGITRLSAVETVRARIGLAVELGLLGVGEQLPADIEVATALDVSETTARRALRSLAQDGVLRRVRGRTGGTFVADRQAASGISSVRAYRADAGDVRGLIDQRLLLETGLTHFAALAASAADLDELAAAVAAGAAAPDWASFHAADERFHLAVARAAHRPRLVEPYRDTLHRLYAYYVPYPIEYLHGANQEHAELLDALRAGDVIAAVAVTERHVSALHTTMFVGLDAD